MPPARNLLLAPLAAALLATACGGSPATEPAAGGAARAEPVEVVVQDFAYDPSPVSVSAGTTIMWTNDDAILHTVTSGRARDQGVPGVSEQRDAQPDGIFDGPLPEEDATFSFTFEETGTFSYYCAVHAGMRGEVIVE